MTELRASRRHSVCLLVALLTTACAGGGSGESGVGRGGDAPLVGAAMVGSRTWAAGAPDALSGATRRYLPPDFDESHTRHVQALEDCGLCHHPLEGREVPAAACRTCHEWSGGATSLRRVMHRSCRGCHTKRERRGQATGPVTCLGCHEQRGQ